MDTFVYVALIQESSSSEVGIMGIFASQDAAIAAVKARSDASAGPVWFYWTVQRWNVQ